MRNYRLAATLVLFSLVALPMALHWLHGPGVSWYRPYVLWSLVILATWFAQRRRAARPR
ncbi:MAG: hypothetical protein KatS3mg124_2379 [Porticoccaceae bacterium]|nr:MAG: hypothetical protein KatS3mg124_2379 [Porticoccaceae bacterium]